MKTSLLVSLALLASVTHASTGLPPGDRPLIVKAGFMLYDINEIEESTETFEFEGALLLNWHDPGRLSMRIRKASASAFTKAATRTRNSTTAGDHRSSSRTSPARSTGQASCCGSSQTVPSGTMKTFPPSQVRSWSAPARRCVSTSKQSVALATSCAWWCCRWAFPLLYFVATPLLLVALMAAS